MKTLGQIAFVVLFVTVMILEVKPAWITGLFYDPPKPEIVIPVKQPDPSRDLTPLPRPIDKPQLTPLPRPLPAATAIQPVEVGAR